jgi:hypothetical protein
MGKRRQRRLERQMMEATQKQMAEQQEKLEASREALEQQKQEYKEFTFENPYADVENFYEDVQVDTQAAEFQMEQAAQQRANILSGLRGAAGASGVAGLAQALANQATMQTRQVSVDLARQERQGQMMARQGAQQADMLRRQGEAAVQSAEFGRTSTLLASEYGMAAGAEAGVQAAYANEMSAFGSASQMQSARIGMYGQIIGGIAGAALGGPIGTAIAGKITSERKLKRNITLVGKSPSGLNIYNFEYINPKHGEGVYQGVMSDEIPKEAVLNHPDGHEMVDYSLIDVNFKKIK